MGNFLFILFQIHFMYTFSLFLKPFAIPISKTFLFFESHLSFGYFFLVPGVCVYVHVCTHTHASKPCP